MRSSSGLIGLIACAPGLSDSSGLVSAAFDDIYFTPYDVQRLPGAAVPKVPDQALLAAALFRAGDVPDAANRLRLIPSAFAQNGGDLREISQPWTLLFLSMALHQLGDSAAAQTELDKAIEWMEQTAPGESGKPVARINRLRWFERLRLNVLRHEAEQLLSASNSENQ